MAKITTNQVLAGVLAIAASLFFATCDLNDDGIIDDIVFQVK